MIIYCATNKVNNKKYVGQTINSLEERIKGHLTFARLNKDGCRLFWRAIRKYGSESFEWSVLFETENIDELNYMESYYIKKYDTTNPLNGYNLKGGGHNPFLTDEVKKRIGESQKGKLNHMYGIKGKDNPSSIMVYNVTDDTYYDSATICSEQTGLAISKICAVCRGDRATTGNKVFRYVIDGEIQEVEPKIKRKSKRVMNTETNIIYDSCVEASIEYYGDKKYVGRIYNSTRSKNNNLWIYV